MTGKEMAKAFSDFANNLSCDETGFVHETMKQHRTLQQSMFRLFVKTIAEWSKQERFDLRNETTIQLCKEIMKIENVEAIPFI